ncbi:TetR family transcriptional regulator [Calidifontibacter sp. DB0510]|uniref:TetR family transcriptional regulator n=1 Tax=Metallococcus carri TaxID=1656884 RepID=A0A967E960_9MICO|nr:TetR/AcrR family transcriptional regulator [Metallococcus carri]NHN56012.1 TetR family transcriptional regulator [Metallococcus carri]NOP37531.1 TetR family transcriptional regulator [Calidifontibacter sp. DB2511S]
MAAPARALAPSPESSARALGAKQDARRDQLAESALETLGELGYARTSLREIAAKSPFSHGVVHYYFASKSELIAYCVRYYKARCVTRYDAIVADSSTAEELRAAFAAKLAETLRDEAPMHRLWYDLRTAAYFEPDLREAVVEIDAGLEAMIWRIIERYADLARARPSFDSPTTYAVLDGLFESALTQATLGDPAAAGQRLEASAAAVLPTLISLHP